MKKLLPILLALLGAGAGVGAGLLTRPAPPPPEAAMQPCGDVPHTEPAETPEEPDPDAPPTATYVKLNNQFIVPVVTGGRVESLVVLSLSLEVTPESSDAVYAREPKLRDAFLQVMFDHANAGGFSGNFTAGTSMPTLRRALLESAQQVMGRVVSGVLIEDIVRQDN